MKNIKVIHLEQSFRWSSIFIRQILTGHNRKWDLINEIDLILPFIFLLITLFGVFFYGSKIT